MDYFIEELGVKSFALLGTDYVYPRTTNNILAAYLAEQRIPAENIFVNYTPFGHSDWSTIVSDVVALGARWPVLGCPRLWRRRFSGWSAARNCR